MLSSLSSECRLCTTMDGVCDYSPLWDPPFPPHEKKHWWKDEEQKVLREVDRGCREGKNRRAHTHTQTEKKYAFVPVK